MITEAGWPPTTDGDVIKTTLQQIFPRPFTKYMSVSGHEERTEKSKLIGITPSPTTNVQLINIRVQNPNCVFRRYRPAACFIKESDQISPLIIFISRGLRKLGQMQETRKQFHSLFNPQLEWKSNQSRVYEMKWTFTDKKLGKSSKGCSFIESKVHDAPE